MQVGKGKHGTCKRIHDTCVEIKTIVYKTRVVNGMFLFLLLITHFFFELLNQNEVKGLKKETYFSFFFKCMVLSFYASGYVSRLLYTWCIFCVPLISLFKI